MSESEEKTALRKRFSALRKALSPEVRREWDREIVSLLQAWEVFRRAEAVAAFFPFGAEPDLTPLFSAKPFLLPRFRPESGSYDLALVEDFKRDLLPGKYGIPEPRPELPAAEEEFRKNRVLFFVPAVACDRAGTRLGRGGGWYDRLLVGVKTAPAAVIYHCQFSAEALPFSPHDVPMGAVVTEKGIINTQNQR